MRDIHPDLAHWMIAVGILLAGYIAIKILVLFTKKALKKTSFDAALHKFICNGIRIVLWIILLGTLLSFLGLHPATFVTVIGAAGAAVAIALKDSLGNVAGGIIILFTKPFKRGDFIEISEGSGQVDSIDLLVTTLKTVDNKIVSIPNGMLSTSVLVNYSRAKMRRVDCKFYISYKDNIADVKELLAAIAEQNDMIYKDPEPIIGIDEHLPQGLAIDLKVWCETEDYWTVRYFLEENVKLAFDEAGIEIPYPQMDVHVKK